MNGEQLELFNNKKEIPIEPGVCPKCSDTDLEYHDNYVDNECYVYYYTCSACEFNGEELFNMEFVGHYDMDGNKVE